MIDTTQTEASWTCPYFHQTESSLYFRSTMDEPSLYGYCHAYGIGYLRVASVQELNEYCKQNRHVRCPVYEWLLLNGRLSLVVNPKSQHHSTSQAPSAVGK
jgi:hypothetical protein